MLLFLIGCLGTRFFLAHLAKRSVVNNNLILLRTLGFLAILPALGFAYLFATNSRLRAREAGGRTWWHCYRPIHAAMYATFAYLALSSQRELRASAWMVLAADAALGAALWANKRL